MRVMKHRRKVTSKSKKKKNEKGVGPHILKIIKSGITAKNTKNTNEFPLISPTFEHCQIAEDLNPKLR